MFSLSELNLPPGYYIGLASLFGLAIGSFLNVVIHRVPRGEALALPASHCPQCGAALRAFDNIPLLSYALLRGRCRQCRTRISPRYPMVELLTALLFAAIVWRTGVEWWALAQMAFGAAMLALIFIDAEHQLLPDVITYPTFVAVLAALALRSGWRVAGQSPADYFYTPQSAASDFMIGSAAWYGALLLALAAPSFVLLDWLDAVLFDRFFAAESDDANAPEPADPAESALDLGRERARQRVVMFTLSLGLLLAAVWVWLLYRHAPAQALPYERAYHALQNACVDAALAAGTVWLLRAVYFLIRRAEGMGLGDVKMMALIGAFLGWYGAFGVLLYGSILGAVAGLIIAKTRQNGFNTALPFGVCLGAMAILVMLWPQ